VRKILIVDNSAWNIYNFRLPHIQKLKFHGYRVMVATPIDDYIGKLNKGVYQQHIPLRHLYPQSKSPFQDLLFFWEIFWLYKRHKPDLVIHFTIKPNIYGSLAARLLKIPAISVVTGLGYPFLHPTGLNRLVPSMFRLAFRRLKKLVVYNQDDRDLLVGRNIIAAEKCTIIPGSGVNTNYFRPLPAAKGESSFVFLFIGRLLQDKGLQEYAQAAKTLRNRYGNMEFWVLGNFTHTNPSAISKEALFDWVNNGHIKYFGFANDVRAYLKHADAMVLPSRSEGLSRSILEAMSMGKPIITTQTAGCRETVEHNVNGFLVPVNDAASLTEAMATMYEMGFPFREAMGHASRLRARQIFDEKIIAESFLNLVKDIVPLHEKSEQPTSSPAIF